MVIITYEPNDKGEYTKEFYISNYITKPLDMFCVDLLNDFDNVVIITSPEGFGKSELAQQIGKYISLKMNVPFDVENNIHFSSNDYINACKKSPKYSVHILDESRADVGSLSTTSKANKEFTNFMSEARDLNMTHIILLPSWWDLTSNLAVWRAKMIINVKLRNRKRGFYTVYNAENKVLLSHAYAHKYKPFHRKLFHKNCDFRKADVIDRKAYVKKKDMTRQQKYGTSEQDNKEKIDITQLKRKANYFHILDKLLQDKYSYTKTSIAKELRIARSTYYIDQETL